jgi:hypothetical protein
MSSPTPVMYVERGGGLSFAGRIGRVRLSKTGRTVYYAGVTLQSLNGSGYKTAPTPAAQCCFFASSSSQRAIRRATSAFAATWRTDLPRRQARWPSACAM